MPATILAQLAAELFAEVIGRALVVGAKKATTATQEAIEERRRRRRERALACADLVVLAAYHDRVVTEAERGVLAVACERALAKVEVEVTLDELLERWGEQMHELSESAFDERVSELGARLERSDVRFVMRSVERLAKADARPRGGLRDAAPTGGTDTVKRFRALLL